MSMLRRLRKVWTGPDRGDRGGDPRREPAPGRYDHGSSLEQVGILARQTAVLVSSGVVSYAGWFVLNVLLARALGPDGFGSWAIAFSVAMLLSTIGLMGADWIVMRQGSYFHGISDVARLRRTIHVALELAGISLLALGVTLVVVAEVVADVVFNDQGMTPLLRLTGVIIPVMGVRQVMVYGTQAFKRMKDAAINRNILQPALRLALVAAALLIVPSPVSAYVGLLVAEVVLAVAATLVLNRRIPLLGTTGDVSGRELVATALPAWGSRLAGQARSQIFPILLGALSSISSSAVFVAANRVAIAPGSLVNTMNQVYIPLASDLYLEDRRSELAAVFKGMAKWSFVLGVPLFVLMVGFPHELMALFGTGFEGGSAVLIVLAIGILFQFGTGPVTVTLIVIGRPNLALLDYLVVLVLEFTLAMLLIPPLGVLGAAIAAAAGTAMNNVLPLAQVWRILRITPYRVDFWKPAVAGAVAWIVAEITVATIDPARVVGGIVAITITAVTYLVMVLLLRLDEQDRAMMEAIVRRGPRQATNGLRGRTTAGAHDVTGQ
jgi:O-antigen/teichoic acid export membrane protein